MLFFFLLTKIRRGGYNFINWKGIKNMKENGIKIWLVVLLVIIYWPAALIYVIVKTNQAKKAPAGTEVAPAVETAPVASGEPAIAVQPLNLDLEATGLLYEAKGAQKILRIYDDRVSLEQIKNARAMLTNNWFQGVKEIYYSDMLGLQVKESSKYILGYIQFETASSRGGDNFNSENSWTYDRLTVSNETAKEIQEFVRKKIKAAKNPVAQTVPQASVADEMLKWKNLFDAGVISEEEFNNKKKELLK